MNKLFAVLLGGGAEGCNVELHDVVFTVTPSLEEAYPALLNKWFGLQEGLHIDASVELKYIDGYEIILRKEKPNSTQTPHLFFVNFGGYKPGFFGEIHEVNFYVAASKEEAKIKAKKELCLGLHLQHCDNNLAVDDIIALDHIDQYYIHLQPTAQPTTLAIEANYHKLSLPEIIAQAHVLREKIATHTSVDEPLA